MSHTIIVSNATHEWLRALAKSFSNKASMDTVVGLLCRQQGHTIKDREDFVLVYKNNILGLLLYQWVNELEEQDLLNPTMNRNDVLMITKLLCLGRWDKIVVIAQARLDTQLETRKQTKLVTKEVAQRVIQEMLESKSSEKSDIIAPDVKGNTPSNQG